MKRYILAGLACLALASCSDLLDEPLRGSQGMDNYFVNESQCEKQLTGCYQSPERGTILVPDISPEDFPPGEPLFVPGCYHNYEIELYYFSLLENVKTRVAAYLAQR